MRELHGWHERGDHGRHARDAHASVDGHAARAHDGPRHAPHDSLKLRMLLDPEARKAALLDYRKKVGAAEVEYAARHPKPKPGDRGSDQSRAPERPRLQGPRPEHAPPETRDKPASKIAAREDRLESQEEERRKPQRSWIPRADMVQAVSNIGMVATAFAVALGDVPAKWDAVAASAVTAVVSNIAWANRRWEEKHGDRSES
jgi:hypothetical protein